MVARGSCLWLFLAAVLAIGAGAAYCGAAQLIAIQDVTVIHPDREGSSVLQPHATVIIENGRIRSVSDSRSKAPAGAQIIDGRGKWLLPGYVDTHVHFFQSGNPYTRPDALNLTKRVPYAQEDARNHARLPVTLRTWLACGVTGVMDVGGPFWNFTVREQAAKLKDAPRVEVTGPLFSMVADPPLDLSDPPIIKITSVEDVSALAKRELAQKPDYLKVWYIHRPGDDFAQQEALVKAVADEAHRAGIPLAVHATELDTAKSALRAGADILVHSVTDMPVDDEFLRLAKERHVIYEPTLYVPRGYGEVLTRNWQPTEAEKRLADPEVLSHMQDYAQLPESEVPKSRLAMFKMKGTPVSAKTLAEYAVAEQNLVKVWQSGITVTVGTDAGNIGTLHGPSIFREMALMVHAGLTPAQTLRAATTNGALAMRLEHETGRIAPGYTADLNLLDSNPLDHIDNASHVAYVIRNGSVFTEKELLSGR